MEGYDTAVIGGGIAGASAAYELSATQSVVLLEREPWCGRHSTGRSAATFTEAYGHPTVRRLAMAGRSFLEHPPEPFEDRLSSKRPILFVGRDDQRAHLDDALSQGAALVASIHLIDGTAAARVCPVLDPRYVAGAVIEPEAADLDVHALHQGFLRAFRDRRGRVRTDAGVEHLAWDGTRWQISIGEEVIAADVVVNAAGAWCDEVAGMAGVAPVGLQPLRRTAFTFAPPPGQAHEGWPMVVDVDEEFYFKPEGPLLLGSPADETPMEPCDVRHDEVDVALGIERIQAATTLEIRHVRHAWAGLRSFVADRIPVAGWAPDHPAFFWLAGQGGSGIKTAPALARAAAGLILDGVLPEDLAVLGLRPGDLAPARLGEG